jgi:hypothetical protein
MTGYIEIIVTNFGFQKLVSLTYGIVGRWLKRDSFNQRLCKFPSFITDIFFAFCQSLCDFADSRCSHKRRILRRADGLFGGDEAKSVLEEVPTAVQSE